MVYPPEREDPQPPQPASQSGDPSPPTPPAGGDVPPPPPPPYIPPGGGPAQGAPAYTTTPPPGEPPPGGSPPGGPPYSPPPGDAYAGYPPQRGYSLTDKPGKIAAIIVLTLISGIFNIFAAFTGTAAVVTGTLGLGLICCAPLTVLPGVLGVFEIIYAMNLMGSPPRPVQPNHTLAALEIACIVFGNLLAVAAGVVSLILYNDPEVRAYFMKTRV
jgi:hypothetical protein